MLSNPHVLFLFIASLFLYIVRFDHDKGVWERGQLLLAIFMVTTLLHMEFADTGWLYRYEAYLVASGILVLAIALYEYVRETLGTGGVNLNVIAKYVALSALALFAILPLSKRGAQALFTLPNESPWYYRVSYQMSLFLNEYYQGKSVAINDIGAVNYFADVRSLDVTGLANMETAKAWRHGRSLQDQLDRVTQVVQSKGVRIGVMSSWFPLLHKDHMPPQWIPVGYWKVSHVKRPHDTDSSTEVWFYAVDPSEKERLTENVKAYASKLPSNVQTILLPTKHSSS
jgi:hypothetical protein